jgi:hypothetical protein
VDGLNLYQGYFVPNGVDPSGLIIKTDCSIDDYLNKHRVLFVKAGADFTYVGASYPEGDLDAEILGRMINSKRVFTIAGKEHDQEIKSLDLHLLVRKAVVQSANKKKYDFGVGYASLFNTDLFVKEDRGIDKPPRWKPKPNVTTQQVLNDLSTNADKYILACHAACMVTMLAGGSSREENVLEESDWIPGDWGHVSSKEPNRDIAGWGEEGENVIYLGNNKWWGHLEKKVTAFTLEEWKKRVAGFNDGGGSYVSPRRTFPAAGLEK